MNDRSDIGNLLTTAREELGWSLQDVAHRTRIPVETLRGLEKNDYASFPSPAYTKSFLSQYSDYLGLDLVDQLDAMETGNVLSNLADYGYLKDHDEHLGDAPVATKRPRKQKQPAAPKEKAPAVAASRSNVLQPLLIFTISALLVSGAVFGFMHFSEKFSETTAETEESANPAPGEEAALGPVSSLPESNPAGLDTANVPRASVVSADLATADPVETLRAAPVSSSPAKPDEPAVVIDNNTPRAIIVDP